MYCVRKFADCWAVYNLDNDESRRLTEAEIEVVRQEIPQLDDPGTAAYFVDKMDYITDKP